MKQFATKVVTKLESMGRTQAQVSRAIGVDASQFTRWLKGKGSPTVCQLLALARFLGVSMEFLADDLLDDSPAGSGGLNADEEFVLKIFRSLRLSGEEAARRLSGLAPEMGGSEVSPSGKDPGRSRHA